MELSAAFRDALASRYAIERPLGRGGMATVYLARDLRHDRPVAVKVLKPELAQSLGASGHERFLAEIRVTANLRHPHVLPLFDSGEADGLLFYIMPFIEGETLRARLEREGRLPIGEAGRIASAIANALEYAHRHHVIHRDLKPENILLQEGQPLVADFGIALAVTGVDETRLTAAGSSVGTPQYMSPEQAAGDAELDARTDIYSLGAILYEMIAGRPPHVAATPQQLFARLLQETAPDVALYRPDVPPALAAVLARALRRERTGRWPDAAAFREALEASLSGAAAPAGGRRGRIVAIAAAVAIAALLAAGVMQWMGAFDRPATSTGLAALPRSIVVLPLENHSAEKGDEYFSDGLTEELLHQLTKVENLQVAARTSSFAFKGRAADVSEIARQLKVDGIVSGSLRRSGDRLRVTVQLVDVSSGRPIWSEQYERELRDVFQVQDEIARAIAARLRSDQPPASTVASAGQPISPEAFDAYLRGRYEWNRRTEEGARESIRLFTRAAVLAPNYARAHAGLAEAWAVSGFYGYMPARDAFTQARAAAERALALDPASAEARNTLAYVALYFDWDVAAAEREFERAITLSPRYAVAHQWHANALAVAGRFDEAEAAMFRALEYDPLAPIAKAALGWIWMQARDYDAAERQLRATLKAHPGYFLAHLWLGQALELSGRADAALLAFDDALAASPGQVLAELARARALARAGRGVEAERALAAVQQRAHREHVEAYPQALVLIALDDHDAAFGQLERAVREREHSIAFLRIDPALDPLRHSPRFARLLQSAGPAAAP